MSVSSSVDVLHKEKIQYDKSITTNSKELKTIDFYTRTFQTNKDYKIINIKINIPYTSNDVDYGKSKVILFFDNEPICDLTMFDRVQYSLKPITIDAIVVEPPMGSHKMELKACVQNGTLNIPHYNPGFIEHTINPKLFGSIHILGFL